MAYNRGEELQNKIDKFSQAIKSVKMFKFIFFSYAFISFLFWFLNCFEFEWLYMFSWIFVIPYNIVGLFYKPTGLSADFTLAIIGIIGVIAGFICEYVLNSFYQKISDLREELERYEQQRKRSKAKKVKPPAPVNYTNYISDDALLSADENFALLFIIQPHIHKIKTKSSDLELTFQEVELWKQRINKCILENIKSTLPMQKGYYRKNFFCVYKDFSYIDDFIYYIKPVIEAIIEEFKKYLIDVQFNYVLSTVIQLSAVEKELDLMDTILSLNFVNIFILTNSFKKAYETKLVRKYEMELKGEYNLSKNLSISNIQPLFTLKKKQGEKNENENYKAGE